MEQGWCGMWKMDSTTVIYHGQWRKQFIIDSDAAGDGALCIWDNASGLNLPFVCTCDGELQMFIFIVITQTTLLDMGIWLHLIIFHYLSHVL